VSPLAAWVAAEAERMRDQQEADRLTGELGCEVTPHPFYVGVFEVSDQELGLVLVSDVPDEIRTEVRRHGLRMWLNVLGSQGQP
jgi:hypothetical protein